MTGASHCGGRRGGFASCRAQLLGRTGVPGPARRRALARLTDGWLGELALDAGVNVGGVALVAVGGYGRGELLAVLATSIWSCCIRRRRRPAYAGMLAERLWYPIWDSGDPARPLGAHPSAAPGRSPGPTCRPCSACWTCGTSPATPTWPAPCTGGCWPTGASDAAEPAARPARRPARSGRTGQRRAGLRHHARPQGVPRRPARPVGDAGGGRVLGGRLPAPGSGGGPRPTLLDVRDALHDSHRPAPATGCRCRSRTRSPAGSGCADRDALLRTHRRHRPAPSATPVDLTWHRVDRRCRRPSGTARSRRPTTRPQRRPLADGVVEQDGEAVLARAADPADRPAAGAARGGRGRAGRAAGRRRPPWPGWPAPARRCPDPWPAERAGRVPVAARRRASRWSPSGRRSTRPGLITALLPGLGAAALAAAARPGAPLHRRPAPDADRGRMPPALVRQVGPARPAAARRAAARHRQGPAGDHATAGAEVIGGRGSRRMGLPPADIEIDRARWSGTTCCCPRSATRRDLDDPATVAAGRDGGRRRRDPARPAARADRGGRAGHRAGRLDRPGRPGRSRTWSRGCGARWTASRRRAARRCAGDAS